MGDLAVRKYGASLARGDAFKRLVVEHLLPLKQLVKRWPSDELRSDTSVGQHMEAEKEVLAFFDRNKESLMAIFVRYAMGDTPSGTASWSSINDSLSTMSEREFTKFCVDFKILPVKLGRPEVVTLFKRAALAAGTGVEEDITYPQFVELLVAMAERTSQYDGVSLLSKVLNLFRFMDAQSSSLNEREVAVFQFVRREMQRRLRDSVMQEADREKSAAETSLLSLKSALGAGEA